jgi:hypothetical protein
MTYQVYTNKCGTANCNDIPNSFELTIDLPPELNQYSPITLSFNKSYSDWSGTATATATDCSNINISVIMTCDNGIVTFSDMIMESNGYYVYSLYDDLEFTSTGGEIKFEKIVILVNNQAASSNRCCCDNLKNKCDINLPSFSIQFIKNPDYSFPSVLFLYYGVGESCANIPPLP